MDRLFVQQELIMDFVKQGNVWNILVELINIYLWNKIKVFSSSIGGRKRIIILQNWHCNPSDTLLVQNWKVALTSIYKI